ncbi:hypothetical protein [Qipengyuania sp. JC766]|uniref:hypothetical protein n=1 Tax=Qipengyuania sp. JC766 TaxID=3232139 RepID=UPI0034586713
MLVQATRAPIGKKDVLKARQYRWNAMHRVWEKELEESLVPHEEAWFYTEGLPAPTLRTVTAQDRHR